MQNQPYETPVMKKLGSVKDLTKGGSGIAPEPNAGGSYYPAPG
jgi:hypothetical protein